MTVETMGILLFDIVVWVVLVVRKVLLPQCLALLGVAVCSLWAGVCVVSRLVYLVVCALEQFDH